MTAADPSLKRREADPSLTRREDIASQLERFVRDHFQISSADTFFTPQADLWNEGYVDSTGVVEVIAFLEDTFAVTLPEAVLFSPDFRNIEGIARLVSEL